MNKKMTRQLVVYALDMAVKNRKPTKGLIFHLDRGSRMQAMNFNKYYGNMG